MIVLTRISSINLKNNRMDKLEYIPGDLVKFATNTYTINNFGENFLQSKIYALISTNSTKTAFVEDIDILPIPLTPEILEKNGWYKEEKDGSVFSLSEVFMGGDKNEEGNYTCFQLYYQNKTDGWVIDMRGEPLKFEVHYIHELHHLLFGLGINHEMEV